MNPSPTKSMKSKGWGLSPGWDKSPPDVATSRVVLAAAPPQLRSISSELPFKVIVVS